MSAARLAVGIDLGTTHTALAVLPFEPDAPGATRVMNLTQVVAQGEVEGRDLLPSFVYFAHDAEPALALPWDTERRFAVGAFARSRGSEAADRVIASAKSWLSHGGVDRRAGFLPLAAPADIEKISPVEASFRILDHLAEAFRGAVPELAALGDQDVILTVPASFDASARDLTVEAALAAGLDNVALLEEPQAALYAWLERHQDDFRQHLKPGDSVLVVDVGGGTTDFSLIEVIDENGALELRRVAVGDHILLGGDNMDLALAYQVRQKLAAEGHELDRSQVTALTFASRTAKEKLLAGRGALDRVSVVVPGRGSSLFAGTLRSELTREDVERFLVDGFFPQVAASERPKTRPRAGLTQAGLPYAHDPAITRHLAEFLTRQAAARKTEGALLHPTAVLFNGGVFKAEPLRTRLLDTLNGWLVADGAAPARVLPGEDLDHAVARGAAYYARVRRGHGLRIRGGTARAYYVGIESPMPAVPGFEPPIEALCVAPLGMEEGTEAELPPQELAVVVGEPVSFRFFGSSTRRGDRAGTQLERWKKDELEELAPIELTLPPGARAQGDVVPVRLQASVTAVGTLEINAVPLSPLVDKERWKIELSVRHGEVPEAATSPESR